MPDCLASSQSGTGLKKKLTMPEQVRYRTKIGDAGRNADAGISFLDADAQLWMRADFLAADSFATTVMGP